MDTRYHGTVQRTSEKHLNRWPVGLVKNECKLSRI